MNVLFITLDQFRADSYGAAGHPLVKTPNLDRLAREGVRLANHYSQSAPCSPGRAALYTGMYQMNNRVVANGTPLSSDFDNISKVARRAGYDPTLFGYTDQGLDPNKASGFDDPRLDNYDGILPGFSVGLYLPESQAGWVQWLRSLGYEVESGWAPALRSEPNRPAEVSLSGFVTRRFLDWLRPQDTGWFAHLSYLRPHPPYAAAGEYSKMYDPDDVALPIAPVTENRHAIHEIALSIEASAAPKDERAMRELRAQYYGMISEIDMQLGRVFDAITERGEWDQTIIVVTSDHGEQLGDHGLVEKLGFFPQSYNIIGIWRDPRLENAGSLIEQFTENVDLLPTLCESLDQEIPVQVDGESLLALFEGRDVKWRSAAHYEWDYRNYFLDGNAEKWKVDRRLARQNLAVSVTTETGFVQFADGSYRCFDLVADPTWRTECTDETRVLAAAQEQLLWRQTHTNRSLTDMLLTRERPGRWPKAFREVSA